MYNGKRVGVGITTWRRPSHFHNCIRSVSEHLLDVVDEFYVYNDGSGPEYEARYQWVYQFGDFNHSRFEITHDYHNRGVAYAKNHVMRSMADAGCDYIFTLEDDQLIKSSKAVTAYIDAHNTSNIHHLLFAHHGPANEGGPVDVLYDGEIEVYTACVGAWNFYTKEILALGGYMDHEHFFNAYEHCEHSARLGRTGLCLPFWRFPDVRNSKDYIEEQPDALVSSQIRAQPNWWQDMHKSLEYWKSIDKETWSQ